MLPLIIVTVPICVNLLLLGKASLGKYFGHISHLGVFLFLAPMMISINLAGFWVINSVVDPESGWMMMWMVVLGFASLTIAMIAAAIAYRFGRCLFISGRTGLIRFYNMARPLPKSAGAHVDLVDLLVWDKDKVDMWGMGILEERMTVSSNRSRYSTGDISEDQIKMMIGFVNSYLVKKKAGQ